MAHYQERKVRPAPPCNPVLPSQGQWSQPPPLPGLMSAFRRRPQHSRLTSQHGWATPNRISTSSGARGSAPNHTGGLRLLQGIHEMSEGESFVHEEIEAPRESRIWPNSQGKTEENAGPGHVAPGDRCSQKVSIGPPVGCSCQRSPADHSPGTSIKCLC